MRQNVLTNASVRPQRVENRSVIQITYRPLGESGQFEIRTCAAACVDCVTLSVGEPPTVRFSYFFSASCKPLS